MIIADLIQAEQDVSQQLNEVEYQQSCFEAGLDDGGIFWNCPIEMEKNISYHQGYIQALKNRIFDMQYGISPIDPECGF